jgi:hypothetical protein
LRLPGLALLALALTALVGCQSAKEPGSNSHASVRITGHSMAEIQKTATAVFGEEGYTLAPSGPQQMVFERPGSRQDALKWGGWWGEGVIMRVKVQVAALADSGYVLQADAYAVQNSPDEFFRNESRTMLLDRRPYQQLLDETARRLK